MPARDFGGMFALNNPDDGTPITQMFKLNEHVLLVVTEKCTYRIRGADQIDPERTNPALKPNFQQKLFDHGTKSELMCRSLLQAKVMFRKEFQSIDIDRAMQLSFDALEDLVSRHEAAQIFKTAEQGAIEKTEALRQNRSETIPAVGNVRGHCKTFIQKADHFAGSLLAIVRLFFVDLKGKGWDDFHQMIKSRYGESDPFYKASEITTPLLRLVRNTRDCLEHANLTGVKTTDFEPQPDGTIEVPSIEIDFRKSTLDRCSISSFMEGMTKGLLDSFEMIVVHTSAKNIQPMLPLPFIVHVLSEIQQTAWHVRFAYGMYHDGQFAPCG